MVFKRGDCVIIKDIVRTRNSTYYHYLIGEKFDVAEGAICTNEEDIVWLTIPSQWLERLMHRVTTRLINNKPAFGVYNLRVVLLHNGEPDWRI